MFVVESIERLGLAYRKAKVDLYYSSHADLNEIAVYEDQLHDNLSTLFNLLNNEDESWVQDPEFIGSWKLVPKTIILPDNNSKNPLHFSSPKEKWEAEFRQAELDDKPTAQFRLMAQCKMGFHVLSSLWMLEVGHLFDAKLKSTSFGNRIRRTKDGKDFSELSLGSFAPYLKPFRDWRDQGMEAIQNALDKDNEVVAITADVTSFYHELNAGFMDDPFFIEEVLNLRLSAPQQKLNRLFIKGLQTWADQTPLKKGLPVGLPAAAVIANISLLELDNVIESQTSPLYYGRYVDDILLVIKKGSSFQSSSDVWEWIFSRSKGLLGWSDFETNDISFTPRYLEHHSCKVHFSNSKNKVFLLSGDTGKALLETIRQKIQERASEWRSMPRISKEPNRVGADILLAAQASGEAADSLRNAASLSVRRAEFAMRLRDMEAYERDLQPTAWQEHRAAFLNAFVDHIMVLPHFFELAVYLPRVVKIATACEDFILLKRILSALIELQQDIKNTCKFEIKSYDLGDAQNEQFSKSYDWQQQLNNSFWYGVYAAFPPNLSEKSVKQWNDNFSEYTPINVQYLQSAQARLFSYDLAHIPARFASLPKEFVSRRGIPDHGLYPVSPEILNLLPNILCEGQEILSKEWLGYPNILREFIFATRPFSIAELALIKQNYFSEETPDDADKIILSLRGFKGTDRMPHDNNGVLTIDDSSLPLNCRVGVSSWKTSMADWENAVDQKQGRDFERYNRFNQFIDRVLADPADCRYLILPELALPATWFIRTARKLHARRISLISGIEYLHTNNNTVHNQVWASLSHDGLGFSSFIIYRQDKQTPAIHEEQELYRMAGLKLEPKIRWPSSTPPIIQHGKMRFAMLVCSEMTNIAYRASLSGKIDALIVPEWNQDTETFNALVESAALDIPAFVIQCNDRQYGDSRIRAPFKDSWKRDLLRVKGGVSDYCVVGDLDVVKLRQFQSSFRSPNGPFKPVPDGFEICPSRKMTPKAE